MKTGTSFYDSKHAKINTYTDYIQYVYTFNANYVICVSNTTYITHKNRKLFEDKKLLYIPYSLQSINNYINALNRNINQIPQHRNYLQFIYEFREISNKSDMLLVLCPMENDKFCGILLVTNCGNK